MDYLQFIDFRNKSLVDFLKKRKYHIKVKPSKRNTWTIDFSGNQIIIGFKKSTYPISCFTHELLHAEIQINGFKRLRYGKSSLFPMSEDFAPLMEALDQELQHHKMFQRFIQLGFSPSEFYNDNDIQLTSKLDTYLNSGNQDLLSVLLRFFPVIAPGGAIQADILKQYNEKLKSLNDNAYRPILEKVQSLFECWAKSSSLDAEPFIKQYIQCIASPSKTWIGYGTPNEFPRNGFFVDNTFYV